MYDDVLVGQMARGTHITRRGVLRALGAGAGASLLGGPAAADHGSGSTGGSDRIEVVTHRRGDDPARTATVPRDWYDQKRRARRAASRLRAEYARDPGVLAVGVGVEAARIEEWHRFAVEVHVDATRGTDAHVPPTVDGVPVHVNRRRPPTASSTDDEDRADGDRRPIYGGVAISSLETATAAGRVTHEGREYLLTPRHMHVSDSGELDSCSTMDATGVRVECGGVPVGPVARQLSYGDAALVELDEGGPWRLDDGLVGREGRLAGRVTRDGADDLLARKVPVEKRGVATGTTRGPIRSYHGDYCSGTVRRAASVEVAAPQGPGDSGALIYHALGDGADSELYAVSVATQEYEGNASGTAAYDFYRRDGVRFG